MEERPPTTHPASLPHQGDLAPEERTDRLYRVARLLVWLAMRVVFRRLRVRGGGSIPDVGPVILAANHPRGILDSFSLALATRRKVHFLARSTLFQPRWRGWLVRRLGVLPLYRRMDAAPLMERNEEIFRSCGELLERGGVIGVFPEGITHVDPQVKELRTGAARLALEAEAQRSFALGVRLVPVGINLSPREGHRSELGLNVGEPIVLDEWRDAYAADPQRTVRDLTAVLRRGIEGLVVHLEDLSREPVVEMACELFLADWLQDSWILPEVEDDAAREVELRRRVAGAVEYYARYQPALARGMAIRMEAYRRGLRRLRLTHATLQRRTGALPLLRRSLPTAALAILGAPLAVSGWLIHELPQRLSVGMARRLATHPAQVDAHRIWIGLQAFALFYALALFALHAWLGLGWRGILAALVLFPALGWLSSRYFGAMRRSWEDLRIVYLRLLRRTQLEELRFRRTRLAQDQDRLRRFFLAPPDPSPTGSRSASP